ncbi:MAG: hypothetical protein K2X03_21345 [Bryobacteraceae bacterium]|nr:hypothetical protein [Bryobacteraceae bacterium]
MSSELITKNPIDPRVLVRWLGPQGAKAGLTQSKAVTVEILTELASSMGITLAKSASRQQLAEEIVKVAGRRIDKSIDELYAMSEKDLLEYFGRVEPTSEEILDVLRSLDLTPRKAGHQGLVEIAARELSETGRFKRISSSVTAVDAGKSKET